MHAFSSDGAAVCFANSSRVAGRTSYLLTEFGAPVTNVDLDGGYTIESFLKLDGSWTADDNRWSAAVTRAGRRSALPTQWSADHDSSPAFLSVSNLREFQWGTIPGQEWGYSSSLWSGEILLDSWHHVAVVNDPIASTTIMYVDGVPVLRNATGLDGMLFNPDYPWVIGASWARDEPSHGWNGCVGETRIVDRAITPAEFLIERADIDSPFALDTAVEATTPSDFVLTELSGRGAPGSQVQVTASQGAGAEMFAAVAPQVVTVDDDGTWAATLEQTVAGAGTWSVQAVPAMGTRLGDGAELVFAIAEAEPTPGAPGVPGTPGSPGEPGGTPGDPGTPGQPGGTPGQPEGTSSADGGDRADGADGEGTGGGLAATGVTVTSALLAVVLLALGLAIRGGLARRRSHELR
ncbi:hypothetical protein C8046_08080 [Serinibacter arcticus]|uniref:Uncharacterized protein n=1 Tax=Serinibacter arcticus TaxID=1655435 RepID=A0A2U1ZUF4_9MICO|nr:LamG-like jellyroll fold domain-containing protein [Serinibacter arcticus]PWD50616.1 hypothetical protein C8046_08080 [Serinibacter arcticus]